MQNDGLYLIGYGYYMIHISYRYLFYDIILIHSNSKRGVYDRQFSYTTVTG